MAEAKIKMPEVSKMLEAGAHFGHETRRWNPKMEKYIHTSKGRIHILDLTKTSEQLQKAADFLVDAASRGEVIFVGTKKQAADIVKEAALSAGAHYVVNRWAGGLLTNFKKVGESFRKLQGMQKAFDEGVEDRTKYEVTLMKKEWGKLNRLYEGINRLSSRPTAVVIVDTKFEKIAVREARKIGAAIVGLVDTNSDPDMVDYVIPVNDDAISSIKLVIDTLAEAVKMGNKGNGVKYMLKDYTKAEVVIKKSTRDPSMEETAGVSKVETETLPSSTSNTGSYTSKPTAAPVKQQVKVVKTTKSLKNSTQSKGILERVQNEKENKNK